MSFNDEVLKDGRGKVLRIDASTDKFSTIAYRWGSAAGVLDGTNQYSNRIVSVAPVRRGLGNNRVAAGSSCEVVLDNSDGALDALAGRSAISIQAKLRLRIYVCLFTPGASPLTFTSKLLGEFTLTEWVRQTNTTLTLPLGDDVMGALSQQAALPTLYDWHAVGGSAATNPLYDGYGLPDTLSEYSSVQLAFGEDWVLALPHIIPVGAVDTAYQDKVIVPICVTSSTAAASGTEITQLRVLMGNLVGTALPALVDIPQTFVDSSSGTPTTRTIWSIERSPTITKDGKTFKIIYLVVRADLGALDRTSNYITGNHNVVDANGATNSAAYESYRALGYASTDYNFEFADGYSGTAVHQMRGYHSNDATQAQYGCLAAAVRAWYVKGIPLSARTQTTSPIQHPVDVLTDLATYYSNNTGITVDTAQAARVKAASRNTACAGTVQPWQLGPKRGDPTFQQPPSLRQVITSICQSADIDCFIDWSGQFSFSCDFWDFTVATSGSATWTPDGGTQTSGNGTSTQYLPMVVPETWLADGVERWVPGAGERWAPFNRLWMNGGRASPADGIEAVPYQGPWDFDTGTPGAIALADRIIELTLEQGWRPYRQQALQPAFWRSITMLARDMVRFRTHIGGLQLELGQYFALSWTRGPTLAGPYSGSIFQCDAITYSPGDDTVEVTAVWRDDITTERQYLLDDETLLVRSKGALTGSATTSSASAVVTFGGTINTTTMGVAAGDILLLRDTSEAADSFARNLAARIATVDSTTQVTLVAAIVTGGVVVNSDWSIVRGATTYPTVVSDPTNYPLGGDRYGKVTDTSGQYSNAATGNRLNSG